MNSLARTILEWALATSLVLSLVFLFQFYNRSHQARVFQMEIGQIQQNHLRVNQTLNAILNDTLEYSRHDASIVPILQGLHVAAVDQFLQANGIKGPATGTK